MGTHAFALTLVLGLTAAGAAAAGPECRCLYDGKSFEQGALVCIRIGAEARLARCGMALNNSSWTFVKDGCPTASMTPVPPDALARVHAG